MDIMFKLDSLSRSIEFLQEKAISHAEEDTGIVIVGIESLYNSGIAILYCVKNL